MVAVLGAGASLPAAPAQADTAPLFTFSPHHPPPSPTPPPPIPPPNSYLNGPCGLAVDSNGDFYVADHYHDTVDVYDGTAAYSSSSYGSTGYITQLSLPTDSAAGPCYLALDSTGNLYVGDYHGAVRKYTPAAYPPTPGASPPTTGTSYAAAGLIDPGQATGLAIDGSDNVYVAHRDRVSVYGSGGAHQLDIGLGSLSDASGVAVSASGDVYVADAADETVKVFDPADSANFPDDPSATIDGSGAPSGGFSSLRDAALALDAASDDLYVLDDTQPTDTEQPRGRVDVFDSAGVYLGHLKYDVVDGEPSGIAVDDSAVNPGRLYVSSGNTHFGGIYAYGAGSATTSAPLAPSIPPTPPGGGQLFPPVSIGAAAPPPGGIACEGDACQVLPPDPTDPTLTTLLQGIGNPPVRYVHYGHHAKKKKHNRKRRHKHHKARKHKKSKHRRRAAAARMSVIAPAPAATTGPGAAQPASSATTSPAAAVGAATPTTRDLLPGGAGFDAAAWAADGSAATQAGSHPYSLDFSVGLDQGSGEDDLRDLMIELPPGLLLDPAFSSTVCTDTDFATPRSSPYESSQSGESCPDRSQLGTVDVTSSGQTRRFGLFELDPAEGSAFRLGAAPFGQPLVFDAHIDSDQTGTYLDLQAADVPQALAATSLKLTLWGTPWDASHNTERGNCLDEAEPGFAWCKSSAGEPLTIPPRALLTLPTECADSLPFEAQVSSWQQDGTQSATAENRDSGDNPVPIAACSSLPYNPTPTGYLSVMKASSASGFAFSFTDDDPGLANPRQRIQALTRKMVLQLPKGVTLNPSLGAGLQTCTPAQLAAESAFNPPGAGCPNGSKIGDFSVRLPFYDGLLTGGLYLAAPHDNPYGSLLAVYLIAKSADRGTLIVAPGKLVPDPGDGTLTATFDDLPQLPYTDLEVDFKTGQRAPLVSPPSCGWATSTIALTPWAVGAPTKSVNSLSPINSGIDFGPCPTGATPPFAPGAIAGGVNANVNSYTPYYVHLSRTDDQQEITSYSLILPKGITGKLAGIPFCPEADIAAARVNTGAAEIANPSCPDASLVGHTLTGYGVGSALTYAPGRVYLAGPYHGAPLSLVTINAATVGPFDLGTIVIRSAFQIDEHTAQLRIDSSASDPIPHIIDGIPLHLRDIRIYMDRPSFTHNPSSCEASELDSTLGGSGADFANPADDSTATVSKHFQLLNCLTLGFKPKLGLHLGGGTHRGAYPSLTANFLSRGPKDSNLKDMAVVIPHQMFVAQNHIRGICTQAQFDAEQCPADSVYGHATALTPLLDDPLSGNVYLRTAPGHQLPDLVADLHSGAIRIVVDGAIGPAGNGGVLTQFTSLPDQPLDRFTMTLYGGKRGLLVNSADICATPPQVSVKALGQNNRGAVFTSKLRGQCKRGHR